MLHVSFPPLGCQLSGRSQMAPAKLPPPFSTKLLIVWGAEESQEVPRPLDRQQDCIANLHQKDFCLSLEHFNALSSCRHATRCRAKWFHLYCLK